MSNRRGRGSFYGFLSHFHLKEVVGAVRNAQEIGTGCIHGQFRNVEAILNRLPFCLGQNVALAVINVKLTAIATGDPPQLDGGSRLGGKADRGNHTLFHIGLGLEIDSLGTLVTILESLAGTVNFGLYRVNQRKIAICTDGVKVTVLLGTGAHRRQVSGGIQHIGIALCRFCPELQIAQRQKANEHHQRHGHRQNFLQTLLHFLTSL